METGAQNPLTQVFRPSVLVTDSEIVRVFIVLIHLVLSDQTITLWQDNKRIVFKYAKNVSTAQT